MNYKLAFKFYEGYQRNRRRLLYNLFPSSRKKIRTNMDLACKGLIRNADKTPSIFSFFKEEIKEKWSGCEEDFFYNIEKVYELSDFVTRVAERKVNREEYNELCHSAKYNRWKRETDFSVQLEVFRREIEVLNRRRNKEYRERTN